MTSLNKNYLSLILIISVTLYGCQQKNDNKAQSEFSISLGTSEVINDKDKPVEKPAVIYRSTDMGRSWSSFAKGIPENSTLSGIKQDGNKLYVVTDYHGLFVSLDGQDNWSALNAEKLKSLDINCIEVEADKLVIGTLNQGVFVSNDGGFNWNQPKVNIDDFAIRAFIKLQEKLYAGTDSGIFESTDMGNTWSHVFGNMQILGFTFLNNKIYAATQYGALVCKGNTSNWESIYEGDALHDIGNDGEYIYAMTIGQQLLKTKNDGELWENAQNGITRPPNHYTNELQHIGPHLFSAQWIGIYHSSNNGKNWEKLNSLPNSIAFSTLEITDYGIIAGISIR